MRISEWNEDIGEVRVELDGGSWLGAALFVSVSFWASVITQPLSVCKIAEPKNFLGQPPGRLGE